MESNKILPENTIPSQIGAPKWKQVLLMIASLLFQSTTWYLLNQALQNPTPINWIFVMVSASVAISVTTFFLLTKKTRWLSDLLVVLSASIYVAISPHTLFVWIGGLVFALFALWYETRLRREVISRVDFSITRVVGGSVSILIYAILILLGFNIYNKISNDFRTDPDKYYNRLGQQAAKTVPYFTKALPENLDLNQPFGDYIKQEAQNNPDYNNASSFEKDIIFNEVKNSFQSRFQITASENQTLVDVMAQVAIGKIREVVEPYQDYVPIVFTILILGILYTFAFLIRWIVIIISWILFKILLTLGFFKLARVQVEVEKLEI